VTVRQHEFCPFGPTSWRWASRFAVCPQLAATTSTCTAVGRMARTTGMARWRLSSSKPTRGFGPRAMAGSPSPARGCGSARNLSVWTEFLRIGTRPEFLSKPVVVANLTRELAWLPPRKGRFGPKAFRRHRALPDRARPGPGGGCDRVVGAHLTRTDFPSVRTARSEFVLDPPTDGRPNHWPVVVVRTEFVRSTGQISCCCTVGLVRLLRGNRERWCGRWACAGSLRHPPLFRLVGVPRPRPLRARSAVPGELSRRRRASPAGGCRAMRRWTSERSG